jgi:predicted nucleic acid-binding protein
MAPSACGSSLALERSFDALPVDEAVASGNGELAAAVVDAVRRPRPRGTDLLIVTTAHAHGARLYLHNGEDLRGIEDLLEVLPPPG